MDCFKKVRAWAYHWYRSIGSKSAESFTSFKKEKNCEYQHNPYEEA